jgi:hypothetical protein
MALVEIFHVVAAERAVASGQTIKEGQIVSLNTDGEVVIQSSNYKYPYGIAGDTKSTTASYMPGVVSGWQNRVSDYFDETKASGKMTVYHSGGEFATDQFATNVASATIMAPLYGVSGILDTVDTHSTSVIVARLIKSAGTYPSGVPGVDLNGDQALTGDSSTGSGGNTYIEIKLTI